MRPRGLSRPVDRGEPVTTALRESVRDGQTVVLPGGEYVLDGRVAVEDVREFHLRGQPDGSTVLRVPRYFEGPVLSAGHAGAEPRALTLRDLTVDITANGVGQRPLWLQAREELVVANVHVRGIRSLTRPSGEPAYRNVNTAQFGVTDADGVGRVESLRLEGGEYAGEGDQTDEFVGVNVEPGRHAGTLYFDDCHVEGFPNNGLYAYRSGTGGTIHVRGGEFVDNGLTNLRLDAGDTAVGSRIALDMDSRPYDRAVALWGQGGETVFRDITVTRESGGNKLLRDSDGDGADVFRDVTVENAGRGDVLDFHGDGGRVEVDGLAVRDTNDEREYYTGRIRRDGVSLRNVEWTTTGDRRRGLYVEDAAGVTVADSTFDTAEVGVEFKDCVRSDVTLSNVAFRRGGVRWSDPADG